MIQEQYVDTHIITYLDIGNQLYLRRLSKTYNQIILNLPHLQFYIKHKMYPIPHAMRSNMEFLSQHRIACEMNYFVRIACEEDNVELFDKISKMSKFYMLSLINKQKWVGPNIISYITRNKMINFNPRNNSIEYRDPTRFDIDKRMSSNDSTTFDKVVKACTYTNDTHLWNYTLTHIDKRTYRNVMHSSTVDMIISTVPTEYLKRTKYFVHSLHNDLKVILELYRMFSYPCDGKHINWPRYGPDRMNLQIEAAMVGIVNRNYSNLRNIGQLIIHIYPYIKKEKILTDYDTSMCPFNLFKYAILAGNLELAKNLYPVFDDYLFHAIRGNSIDVLNWLWETGHRGTTLPKYVQECLKKHNIQMAKWFVDKGFTVELDDEVIERIWDLFNRSKHKCDPNYYPRITETMKYITCITRQRFKIKYDYEPPDWIITKKLYLELIKQLDEYGYYTTTNNEYTYKFRDHYELQFDKADNHKQMPLYEQCYFVL